MNEEWKDIAGYEGLYQVSNLGRVKSVSRVIIKSNGVHIKWRERIRKPHTDHDGYLLVVLSKNNITETHKVHRLVAEAFIPKEDLFATTVNHKDENKANNRVDNLEWLSQGDNCRYSFAGPDGSRWGSKHHNAKPVRCIETGQVFGCMSDASRWLGLCVQAVSISIHQGIRAGGYHWEFV